MQSVPIKYAMHSCNLQRR